MSAATMPPVGPWIDHPKAGRALLVAHKWLKTAEHAPGVDPFALLEAMTACYADLAVQAELMTALAESDPESTGAFLSQGLNVLRLARLRSVALSMGKAMTLPAEIRAQFEALRRAVPGAGDAN